jgi:tetratricopeptide (TPR) repeat protein
MPENEAPDLRAYAIFASLPPEALQYLQSRLVRREIPANRVILHRDVRGDLLAIIATGQVALKTADGKQQILKAGDSFGEGMLRYGVPSSFEASSLSEVNLWLLARQDWLRAQNAFSPAFSTAQPSTAQSAKSVGRGHWWLLMLVCLMLTAIILGPSLIVAFGSNLALYALEDGRPDEAQELIRLALFLQPDSASLHDAYGYLLFKQEDFPAAVQQFQLAVELDSGLASARNNLGVTLLAEGKAEAAVPHLKAVVDLDPGNAQAWENLGDAWLACGERENAASAYLRAYSLDPDRLRARTRWAALILDQQRLEEARRAWLEVIQHQPENDQALLGLGAVSLLEGRPAAALIHLQAAQVANPSDALIRLYLGLSLQALDRPEQAAAEFEQVLALSHETPLVDLARARLLQLYPQLVPLGAGQEGGG